MNLNFESHHIEVATVTGDSMIRIKHRKTAERSCWLGSLVDFVYIKLLVKTVWNDLVHPRKLRWHGRTNQLKMYLLLKWWCSNVMLVFRGVSEFAIQTHKSFVRKGGEFLERSSWKIHEFDNTWCLDVFGKSWFKKKSPNKTEGSISLMNKSIKITSGMNFPDRSSLVW